MPPVELVCLLPARNAAHTLPGWFESVERCADAVIALDDGSTDGTRAMLAAHPLVRRLLTNPVRPSYVGWDDRANRARLLSAAAELSPAWILWLDADERIPPDDALALRQFLARGADRHHAYLVTVYPLVGDLEHFDAGQPLVVGRLFPFEIGQELPTERLHFVPLPTSIPPARWVRTTLRIQHLVALTPEHQRARYVKYQEADPQRRFERRYGHLLREPRDVRRWPPRPPGLPVVLNGAGLDSDDGDSAGLPLSVIVIARDEETRIEGTVRSIVAQEVPAEFELIVVTSGTDRTADIVRTRFPTVRLIELPRPALPGEARNAGLAVARGRFVTFHGSHVELVAGSLAARLAAHQSGYAMVTGTVTNARLTRSGWAHYFLEYTPALPGRPSGPLDAPPASCSYLRVALEHVGGFPDWRAGEDTLVNIALFDLGYGAWHAPGAGFVRHTPSTTPLLRHHFTRGRAFGRVLLAQRWASRPGHTHRMLRLLAFYMPYRLFTIETWVRRWGGPGLRRHWRRSRPLAIAGIIAAWVGMWKELSRSALRPRSGRFARAVSRDPGSCTGT
jgi:glycosyltransferase involved in cell wall biosynthesis